MLKRTENALGGGGGGKGGEGKGKKKKKKEEGKIGSRDKPSI